MTLELKSREKLADSARLLAASFELVNYNDRLYLPMDYETGSYVPVPPPERKVWQLLRKENLVRFANMHQKILFANESEKTNFEGMLLQLATFEEPVDFIYARTSQGLVEMQPDGKFVPTTGKFSPNSLSVVANDNPDDVKFVWDTLVEWLGGEEEQAHSFMYHLGSALSPTWSAAKYLLLLGGGSNGKGVLLQMIRSLFGKDNISGVTRQAMAKSDPGVADLNNMLLNIVMDGPQEYLKDSGTEKTLVAGEPVFIHELYKSSLTQVETNALFLEGLNEEPKTRDKSFGLQRRLVRFYFPNKYEQNPVFAKKMRSPRYLGAFMHILLEHFVSEADAPTKLQVTEASANLQLDQIVTNSIVMQWLQSVLEDDLNGASRLLGKDVKTLIASFQPWVLTQEKNMYSDAESLKLMQQAFILKRSSKRENGKLRNFYKVDGFKPETQRLIDILKGGQDDTTAAGLVVEESESIPESGTSATDDS